MSKLAPEELAALGLEPDVELALVEQDRAPERSVALGKAEAAQGDFPLEHIAALLREQPHASPVSLSHWNSLAPGTSLQRWDLRPEIAVLHHGGQRDFELIGDNVELDESTLALDSRKRPACLRLDHDDVAWLLLFDQGHLTLLKSQPRAQIGKAITWEPTAPPTVPVPDIRAWLAHFPVQPWLLEEAEQLAREAWALARVAAAGLIARLWSPEAPASRSELSRLLPLDFDGPTNMAMGWFSALPTETRESTERSALFETDALEGRLQELEQVAMEDPEQASALGCSWLHRRDNLQSVLFLLKRSGTGAALEGGLAALDQRASEFPSFWALLELEDDERLRAVSWQEPDAWWGQLALA